MVSDISDKEFNTDQKALLWRLFYFHGQPDLSFEGFWFLQERCMRGNCIKIEKDIENIICSLFCRKL